MKVVRGFSVAGVIAIVVVVLLLGVGTFLVVDGNNKATNYNDYDFYSVIEGTKDNGNIGDHVKGDVNAPVKIFEYADYQCSGCASVNPRVNKVVEELDGKLAVVYRSFVLDYHQNGKAAAAAAEAAGLQGYWKEYADKLFAEQSEWFSASVSERTALFDKYFEEVTDGKGDVEKFNADLGSDAVKDKVSFDMGIGKRIGVSGTPAFYIDGQLIKWTDAGEVTVDGRTVSWDSGQSGDDFVKLIEEIVNTKLGEDK